MMRHSPALLLALVCASPAFAGGPPGIANGDPRIPVSVRSYGAPCDGTAPNGDDAPGFNAAIAYAQAHGKSKVAVPSGICIFKTTVVIPANGSGIAALQLVGDGASSIIRAGATLINLISVGGSESRVTGFYFDNTTTGLAQTALAYTAVPDVYSAEFDHNYFTSFPVAITNVGNGLYVDHNFGNSNATFYKNVNSGISTHIEHNNLLGGNGLDFPVAVAQGAVAAQGPEGVVISHNEIAPVTSGSFSIRLLGGLQFNIADDTLGRANNSAQIILDSTNGDIRSIKITDVWMDGVHSATGTMGVLLIDRPNGVTIVNPTCDTMSSGCIVARGTDGVNRPIQGLMIVNPQTSNGSLYDIYLSNALGTSILGGSLTNTAGTVVRANTTSTAMSGVRLAVAPQKGLSDIYLANLGATSDGLDNTPIGGNGRASIAATSGDFSAGVTMRAGATVVGAMTAGSLDATPIGQGTRAAIAGTGGDFSGALTARSGINLTAGAVVITSGTLPTSCSGKPSGTVWNNANALSLCP